MKAIKSLVVAVALTAAGVAIGADAQAGTNGLARGGHWSGGHGTWSGGGNWNGGHWGGGHFGHSHFFGPRFSFFVGAPVFWPGYYWGYPYYYDWYYPRAVYVEPAYRAYPASTPEDAATTVVPSAPGAPQQAPAYLNYCESAKAYYPKVTSCPEGWKFLPSAPAR